MRARLEELGYDLTREDLDEAFARFKDLADRKREITDRDLEAIVSEQVQQPEARFQLHLGAGELWQQPETHRHRHAVGRETVLSKPQARRWGPARWMRCAVPSTSWPACPTS